MKRLISSSIDDFDSMIEVDQEYDSAATSINSNRLPAVYRMIDIPQDTIGLDFGGGKFDNCVEYIHDLGATLCVYDPYNRSVKHNSEVISMLRDNGGADWAVNSNVLNVIKEPEARLAVLKNISRLTKSGAPIYITVYEGRGDRHEGPTKSGYQLNRKTADYLEEVQEVFPDAIRKGKLIIAHNSQSVSSSTNVNASKLRAGKCKSALKCSTKLKRISSYNEFDNGYVIHNDWRKMSDKQAESLAKQMSIENPDDIFYVQYDDVMNPDSDLRWIDGQSFKYDEVEMRAGHPHIKSINGATDLDSLQQIQSELNKKLYEVMTELPFGFLPEEVDEYSVVEVTEDRNTIKAEVRAELNYDELSELCEFLNPVVQKYDTDAYFEHVEPGIIEAYIYMDNEVTSSADITSSDNIDATSEDLLAHDAKFRYQMLDRMTQDCNYFLDHPHPKFLWAGNVDDQIRLMRDLYNSFSDGEKPEWISMDDIDKLESAMNKQI